MPTKCSGEMAVYYCWTCDAPFAMSRAMEDRVEKDGSTFYCVKGCRLSFGEGKVTRLKRQLATAQSDAKRAKSREHAAVRKSKRFKCPSCPRDYATAAGLQKHIRNVHQAPLKLADNAGPTAVNTKVG